MFFYESLFVKHTNVSFYNFIFYSWNNFKNLLHISKRSHMEWIILIITIPIYFFQTYVGYTDVYRRSNWFLPVMVSVGLFLSCMWFSSMKYIDDKNRILFYCICWDCMMMMISYFVPIIFFDLNLNKMTIFGFVLMFISLAIIKLNMFKWSFFFYHQSEYDIEQQTYSKMQECNYKCSTNPKWFNVKVFTQSCTHTT